MEARLLAKTKEELTSQQIQDFIIGTTQGLMELKVFFYGYCYEPKIGIYLIGPRSELEKVKNSNGIEDFDFSNYIKTHPNETFWLVDWTTDVDNPKLVEYKK